MKRVAVAMLVLAGWLFGAYALAEEDREQRLPGESLYHLQAPLTDQHGSSLALQTLRGRPVLVAMFYASCTSVCPMLIGKLKQIESALSPELRAQTSVLLISLDPERDSVARLAKLSKSYGIDARRWSIVRTTEKGVREAAALLGARHSRMPDGAISHSPLIALLDRNGVLVTRSEGLRDDPVELAWAIEALLDAR